MRITIIDPYEFDYRDSEEFIAVAVASRKEFGSSDAFREAIASQVQGFSFGVALPKPRNAHRQAWVIEKTASLHGLTVFPREIKRCLEYTTDWSPLEIEVVLECDDRWVWCSWYTTA